jgi:uncharacterized membrane protein
MAIGHRIRSPIEWAWDHFKQTGRAVESAAHSMGGAWEIRDTAPLAVRRISAADLRDVLVRGLADFGAYRTDVVFLCLFYPIVGLLLSRLAFGYGMLPLIFPLASGFALIAPFLAVGLCEMSRRREEGIDTGWRDAFGVARSPSLGAIMALGLVLLAILILWLFAAYFIYAVTLGPEPPDSVASFVRDVLTTPAGWTMAGVGVGVGFLFALLVLTISVVSFPLLLDRDVGVYTAVSTSIRVVLANPGPMAMWGLIIAAGLAFGVIPLLFGLAIVLPVLGHATWHLYRKVLPR